MSLKFSEAAALACEINQVPRVSLLILILIWSVTDVRIFLFCFFVLKFQFSWSCYHSTFQLSICGKKSLHTFEQINISGAVWVCWFSSSDSHLKFSIHKKTIARYLVWLSTAKSPGGDADLIFFLFWLFLASVARQKQTLVCGSSFS